METYGILDSIEAIGSGRSIRNLFGRRNERAMGNALDEIILVDSSEGALD